MKIRYRLKPRNKKFHELWKGKLYVGHVGGPSYVNPVRIKPVRFARLTGSKRKPVVRGCSKNMRLSFPRDRTWVRKPYQRIKIHWERHS